MIYRKFDRKRSWVLSSVATGLILASTSASGPTKNAIAAQGRKPTAKPSPNQVAEPPQLLAVPVQVNPQLNVIQPVSQMEVAVDQKSEVQKQLEALYENDGREMPTMTMNLQPITQPAGQPPQQSATPAPAAGTRSKQSTLTTTQNQIRTQQTYNSNQPKPSASAYPAQSTSQAPRNFGAAIEAQKPSQPHAHQNPVSGFFKKITGRNKEQVTQAPIPPDVNNAGPATFGAPPPPPPWAVNSAPPAAPTAATQSSMKYYAPQQTATPAARTTTPSTVAASNRGTKNRELPANVQVTSNATLTKELPAPAPAIPPLMQQPLPLQAVVVEVELPALMSNAHSPTPVSVPIVAPKKEVVKTPVAVVAKEVATDFPNPFPEVAESEADIPITISPKSIVSATVKIPTTNPEIAAETTQLPASDSGVKPEENPYAVTAKDFSEPTIDERFEQPVLRVVPKAEPVRAVIALPDVTSPSELTVPDSITVPEAIIVPDSITVPSDTDVTNVIAPLELTAPPSGNSKQEIETTPANSPATSPAIAPPSFDSEKTMPAGTVVEPPLEKMKRIRERFGMKGLKGFCPVTLHDDRELVDAKPDFRSTHRSQKFHFASAEARDKFEADPAKYAPAAYGADVVALSRDKEVVEGTLDYAAWFKGRLYLFGTQANYDLFLSSPSIYGTIGGIE